MSADPFRPTLYFNDQCPFCLKVKIFLLESGLREAVEVEEFAPGSPEEAAIKEALAARLTKVTVPAARIGPDEYITDSDEIISRLAQTKALNPGTLPVLNTYAQVALGRIISLFKENAELKRQIG